MDRVSEKLMRMLQNAGVRNKVMALKIADSLIMQGATVPEDVTVPEYTELADIKNYNVVSRFALLPESVWVVHPIQHVVAHSPRLRTVYVLKRIPIQDLRGLLSAQRMYERLFETKEDAELYKVYLERSLKT